MKLSPVSFGSLMCFSINKKPAASIPDMLRVSFNKNPLLNSYDLQDTVTFTDDVPDGTVHNAFSKFGEFLDNRYKALMPKGSNKVILTQADFYINPTDTKTKYFITAATGKDERKIFKALGNTREFYTTKLTYKR